MFAGRRSRLLIALGTILAIAVVAFVIFAWKPAIAPIAPAQARTFDSWLVRRGYELALIGNCNICHSAKTGNSFAGGVPMLTPFGIIYSTNITPDPDTGLGRWSQQAFDRAMRDGVDRE